MKLKPLSDFVLIEPVPNDNTLGGVLFIPAAAQEKPLRGYVVAVGDGKDGQLMKVKEGDAVMYGKFAGHPIEFEGKEYIIMREEGIFAVVEE